MEEATPPTPSTECIPSQLIVSLFMSDSLRESAWISPLLSAYERPSHSHIQLNPRIFHTNHLLFFFELESFFRFFSFVPCLFLHVLRYPTPVHSSALTFDREAL